MGSANISAKKFIVQHLSAQVRARLLFQTEVAIDFINKLGLFTDELLKGLVEQRKELEKQRGVFARNVVLIAFVMYLVSNGQQFVIPTTTIRLDSIPGLNSLLGVIASIHLLFVAFTAISCGVYDGLIYQISMKKFGDTAVDPDIHAASLTPQWMFLKIFQESFNHHHDVHINPKFLGRMVYRAAYNFGVFVLLLLFAGLYAYVVYFLIEKVPNDYFGLGAKAISLAICAYSLFLHFASTTPFAQKVELAEPT